VNGEGFLDSLRAISPVTGEIPRRQQFWRLESAGEGARRQHRLYKTKRRFSCPKGDDAGLTGNVLSSLYRLRLQRCTTRRPAV